MRPPAPLNINERSYVASFAIEVLISPFPGIPIGAKFLPFAIYILCKLLLPYVADLFILKASNKLFFEARLLPTALTLLYFKESLFLFVAAYLAKALIELTAFAS